MHRHDPDGTGRADRRLRLPPAVGAGPAGRSRRRAQERRLRQPPPGPRGRGDRRRSRTAAARAGRRHGRRTAAPGRPARPGDQPGRAGELAARRGAGTVPAGAARVREGRGRHTASPPLWTPGPGPARRTAGAPPVPGVCGTNPPGTPHPAGTGDRRTRRPGCPLPGVGPGAGPGGRGAPGAHRQADRLPQPAGAVIGGGLLGLEAAQVARAGDGTRTAEGPDATRASPIAEEPQVKTGPFRPFRPAAGRSSPLADTFHRRIAELNIRAGGRTPSAWAFADLWPALGHPV